MQFQVASHLPLRSKICSRAFALPQPPDHQPQSFSLHSSRIRNSCRVVKWQQVWWAHRSATQTRLQWSMATPWLMLNLPLVAGPPSPPQEVTTLKVLASISLRKTDTESEGEARARARAREAGGRRASAAVR